MKSRKKVLEEEAKKDSNYRPTEALDEEPSNVADEDPHRTKLPVASFIVMGVIVVLIVVCIIVICVMGPKA